MHKTICLEGLQDPIIEQCTLISAYDKIYVSGKIRGAMEGLRLSDDLA